MTRKVLMTILLSLSALPALASDFGTVFGQPLPFVAQMSQEERRMLRERWEQASPEERARLRHMFKEKMRQLPGGSYANQGMEMGDRAMMPWGDDRYDSGYGSGYEHRHRGEDDRSGDRYEDRRDSRSDDRRGRGRR